MADVPRREVENIDMVFDIMATKGQLDCNELGDALRALNLNPTLALIEKMGGTKKKGEKKITKEEFLPIYAQVKGNKEQGCYEDFLECLKLYDKEENGLMLLAELNHALLSLGEELQEEQIAELFKDCMDPEDEDGYIPYAHIEFVFEIMGSVAEGIDAFDLGDALRCLNLNPTLAFLEKLGATKRRKEKIITIPEFLPMYSQVKTEKEQGCYEDFLECLKLYDKNENGTMMLSELNHALLNLGEALSDEQVEELFTDCMGEEDDDGMIVYAPFLAKMCDKKPEE